MKKIGIITHYYLSNNYGGNLQAYALAAFLNRIDGFYAEQICYDFLNIHKISKSIKSQASIKCFLKRPIYTTINSLHVCKKRIKKYANIKKQYNKVINSFWKKKFSKRISAIYFFNQKIISHSDEVYNEKTILNCSTAYDVFISGSDQVWSDCNIAFTLGFVVNKTKLSYAASLGRSIIPQVNKDFLQEKIKDYSAISVRSKDDQRIVSELTKNKVEIVLDPAFLLTREDWERVATKQNRYKKKYVFCYFLGDNIVQKKLVKQFAKNNKLKVVNIAHFKENTNKVVFNDLFFGDYKPYDVSPADFVALIRDAEYVFTDSFHALVFSMIYHKNFFAFERISKYGDMNGRLINLLQMVDLDSRFCSNNKCKLGYINSLKPIDYKYCDWILEKEIQHSKDYINKYL